MFFNAFKCAAEITWCPKQEIFPGGPCGGNPGQQCLLDFLGKYGAASMPKNCQCQNSGPDKRLCKCDVVCQN
ncbi:hypothetical protein Tsubulata_020169 [Turnera subulata]|uniref:Uncharacterized protein n=1 Tax=Turnera subulata TaxID=218843 RepID=A0A9Q0FR23_9ROSI|nr:hypothetical protein Tsubulata_020169 [Turnera subulata]